jgi:hypothetical protein
MQSLVIRRTTRIRNGTTDDYNAGLIESGMITRSDEWLFQMSTSAR